MDATAPHADADAETADAETAGTEPAAPAPGRSAARRGAAALGRAVLSVLSVSATVFFAVMAYGYLTGSYRFVPVVSGSMAPEIPEGALTVVVPIDADDVRVGDVIAFNAPRPDKKLVVHRVVKIDDVDGREVLRTRGDAAAGADPWEMAIEGDTAWRVERSVPYAGAPFEWVQSSGARPVLLYGGGAVALLAGLFMIWRPRRRRAGAVEPSPATETAGAAGAGAGDGAPAPSDATPESSMEPESPVGSGHPGASAPARRHRIRRPRTPAGT